MIKYQLTSFGGAYPREYSNYTIVMNTELFQANYKKQRIESIFFPQFFTLNSDIAEIYLYKNPEKRLVLYKTKIDIELVIFGYNQQNQRFMEYLNNTITRFKNIDHILIKNLLGIFYGMCENMNSVENSLIFLGNNIKYLIDKCNFYRNENIKSNIYANIQDTDIEAIEIAINNLLEHIKYIKEHKYNVRPSRVTIRIFDTLLINLLKEHNLCEGYIYDDDIYYDDIEGEIDLFNYFVVNNKKIVPAEICLLDGTSKLRLVIAGC
jgi:hypothetical protein